MSRLLVTAGCLGTMAASSPCLADDARSRWYGGEILVVDVSAVAGTVVGGLVLPPVAVGGILAYLFGGPIVHATHDRDEMALVSLGLRLVLPVAGAVIGGKSTSCASEQCSEPARAAAIGMLIGIVVASVTDVVLLAREREEAGGERSGRAGSFDRP